jgi:glycosyltransferase involved in cell wall biosynthesis
MPCYNEGKVLPKSIPPVLQALNGLHLPYELILVNNGSTDETGSVIDDLKNLGSVVRVDVAQNISYSHGIRSGLERATGRIVGYMCCDGQVEPADIVRVFHAIQTQETPILVKLARTQRHDGFRRRVVTRIFNALCRIMFPVETNDINGTPKLMFREDLQKMNLSAPTWMIDFEVMIKAEQMNLKLVEVEAPFYQRKGGKSYIRVKTLFEFLAYILKYRISKKF